MDFDISLMVERIKEKTELKNLSSVGIASGTISAWKTNNRPPRSDDLFKIAQFCGCSMEYLLTGHTIDDDNIFLTREQQIIVNATKQMRPDHVDIIVQMAEALAEKQDSKLK